MRKHEKFWNKKWDIFNNYFRKFLNYRYFHWSRFLTINIQFVYLFCNLLTHCLNIYKYAGILVSFKHSIIKLNGYCHDLKHFYKCPVDKIRQSLEIESPALSGKFDLRYLTFLLCPFLVVLLLTWLCVLTSLTFKCRLIWIESK